MLELRIWQSFTNSFCSTYQIKFWKTSLFTWWCSCCLLSCMSINSLLFFVWGWSTILHKLRLGIYGNVWFANAWMIEFSMQTGCVRPTVSLRIVCCLSKMCIVSKKKNTATDAFIEDFFGRQTRQYEECMSQIVSQI